MALSIKDWEIERDARELARARQSTMTNVIRDALRRERERNRVDNELLEARFDSADRRAQDMVRNSGAVWLATHDEILGYDEHGIPEQR